MAGLHTAKRLNLLRGGGKMSFTYLFYQHIMFRRSCVKCHFANTRRPSDITIADFWGWEKTDPNINADDKGVSLILVNTEKGRELFEKIKDRMTVVPAQLEDCLQPNLCRPSAEHPLRDAFEKDYTERGFKYVYRKYGDDNLRGKYRRAKRRIKNIIKSLIGRK